MRKLVVVAILLFGVSTLFAQKRFKPYTAFGVETSIVASILPGNKDAIVNPPKYGPDLASQRKLCFDLKFNYEYAPFKFLGLSTGAGLSVRGGKGDAYSDIYGPERKLSIYYFNIPARLQLKAGFFWFEPGIQTNVLIGQVDGDNPSFNRDDLKSIYWAYSLMARFNLFKGFSLHLGYEKSFTEVAYIERPGAEHINTSYYQHGYILGARYMFNQPERTKRR